MSGAKPAVLGRSAVAIGCRDVEIGEDEFGYRDGEGGVL